jgi:mono/diheme cytochrome c family protein
MTSDTVPNHKTTQPPSPKVWVIFVVFIVVAIVGGIVVYSLSDWRVPAKAKAMPNPVPAAPQAIGMGMSIYRDRCRNCHGEQGDGKGERAEKLSVAPSDFSDAQEMSQQTDGELFWKISEGHRPMPQFKGKLSEEERWEVVDYIRTFSQPLSAFPGISPSTAPDRGAAPK